MTIARPTIGKTTDQNRFPQIMQNRVCGYYDIISVNV